MSEQEKIKIIAVDGPAGSGKSSVCSEVCRRLGWNYINTGALYRGVAVVASQRGIDVREESSVAMMLEQLANDFCWDGGAQKLYLGSQDLTPLLYSVEAGNGASYIARQEQVRALLLPIQRKLTIDANNHALVDGRDIGTVIFPDADLKVFMTASLDERARRRLAQLKESGVSGASFEETRSDIANRDGQDAGRGSAPMRQADDAVVFDNSGLTVEQAVSKLLELFVERGLVKAPI